MDVTGTIDTRSPERTNREVKRIYEGLFGPGLFDPVDSVVGDVSSLFNGTYPGYQSCDTAYHDVEHTLQTYLATARIFDGMIRERKSAMSRELVTLGLIAILGHDTGFIKAAGDDDGHGGKYTLVHVERSKEFMGRLLTGHGFDAHLVASVNNLISCTGLNVSLSAIPFASARERLAGCVVGTADYLGQMSDPDYLEKLPRLYEEYKEGSVPGFESADDLIKKSPKFFEEFVLGRLNRDFEGVYRFAAKHFGGRDLYTEAIKKNLALIK